MNRTKLENFKIPDFSIKEIVQYFTELKIPISSEDIQKSKTQSLFILYETVLEIYPNIKIIDYLDNNYSEAHYNILLYNALNRIVFMPLGVNNFTFKDLVQPTSSRTISFLSAIVNFSMYRDSKREVYLEINKKINEKEDFCSNIDVRLEQAEQHVKKLEIEKMKEDEEILGIEEKLRNKEMYLSGKKKEYKEIKNAVEELKTSLNNFQDVSSSNQLIHLNLENSYDLLKSQVLEDPKIFMSLIDDMKMLLEKQKQDKIFLDDSIRKCREERIINESHIKEIKQTLIVAVELKKKASEEKSKCIYRNDVSESLINCENEIMRVQKGNEINLKRIQLLRNKLVNQEKTNKEICNQAEEEKNKLNEMRRSFYESSTNEISKIEEKTKLLKEINEEYHMMNQYFNNQFNDVKKELKRLEENAINYFEKLYNSI